MSTHLKIIGLAVGIGAVVGGITLLEEVCKDKANEARRQEKIKNDNTFDSLENLFKQRDIFRNSPNFGQSETPFGQNIFDRPDFHGYEKEMDYSDLDKEDCETKDECEQSDSETEDKPVDKAFDKAVTTAAKLTAEATEAIDKVCEILKKEANHIIDEKVPDSTIDSIESIKNAGMEAYKKFVNELEKAKKGE